ncbi:hypothetical protein WJX73_005008 [Symbiochloris irregularis]|uniref:DDRGK domain-containing protein 1 n=1 Tax=Symbiochloris irregularis TaxID=706552 RepID=A0AAW1PR42_9CHLO
MLSVADNSQLVAGAALAVVLGLLVALVLGFLFVFKKGETEVAQTQAAPGARIAGQAGQPRVRDRAQAGARRRRAAAAAAAAAAQQGGDDAAGSGSEDEHADGLDQRQQEGPAPVKRKDAYEAKRAARDKEREEQEAREEAEAARLAAEEAARQDEEASQWMGLISTEGGGSSAAEAEHEEQSLMQRFVEFVKQRKTVELQELAAEFGFRVQDGIDRIRALESMGHLTGVMDDRGKYIFISMEEMTAVANYIRAKGRVAISELAAKSSQFIDLTARDVDAPATNEADLEADIFGDGTGEDS